MLRFGWPLIRTPRIFLASMKICVGKSFSECKISYRIEPQKVTLFRANATRIRWSVGWSVGRLIEFCYRTRNFNISLIRTIKDLEDDIRMINDLKDDIRTIKDLEDDIGTIKISGA